MFEWMNKCILVLFLVPLYFFLLQVIHTLVRFMDESHPGPFPKVCTWLDLITMGNMFCLPWKGPVIGRGSFIRGGGSRFLPRPCDSGPRPLLWSGRPLTCLCP